MLERRVRVGERLPELAFHAPRERTVAEGVGVQRIEPDRLVQVLDAGVELALLQVKLGGLAE